MVRTQIECFVEGASLGSRLYEEKIEVVVNRSEYGLWGSGQKSYDYSQETVTSVEVFNPSLLPFNYPAQYSMRFTTSVAIYTGALFGMESSIIYFDSFRNFSPVAQAGVISISEDGHDVCHFNAVMFPANAVPQNDQ